MADYYAQAEQQTQAEHNKKVQNLKSQLASNQLALDQQKTGVNQNYDYQVAQQNLQNKLNKNSVSNAMIGRGLGNSSIAVSGLAEQDAKNTRLVGDINRNRTSDLNNIDAQKALLDRNYNAEVGQLEADRLSEIRTLAYQLEDRAFDKDYKNRQMALQEQAQKATEAYQNAYLALQQKQADNDLWYKQQTLAQSASELAWQKEKYYASQSASQSSSSTDWSTYEGYLADYNAIMGGDYTTSERNKLLKQLSTSASMYQKKTGYDLSDIISASNSGITKTNTNYASNRYQLPGRRLFK